MAKIIIILGAPGVGKTTTAKLLYEKLQSPYLEISKLRNFHLKRDWSNKSEDEEQMAWENLVFILKNYMKHGYENVIVTDVGDPKIQQVPSLFAKGEFIIFTLYTDNKTLKNRVLEPSRDSGYRNFKEAININQRIIARPLLENEIRIDATSKSPDEIVDLILNSI